MKTFIHRWNTNEDLFDTNLRSFCPFMDSYTTLMLQKVKEIIKLIQMVYPIFLKNCFT